MTVMAADLREENRRRLRDDLRLRRVAPRSLPATVRLETTTECRLRCLHCFRQRDESGEVMDPGLYGRLARELFPHIEVVEFGALGEPLHDPHLGQRLELIDPEAGPRLDLTTSGDGLLAWVDVLVTRARRIVVSIETFDEDLYPHVRKGARLHDVLRGVEAFRCAADAVGGATRPQLVFRITLLRGNHAILPSLVARIGDAGADAIELAHGVPLEGAHEDLQITDQKMDLGVALQRGVLQGRLSGVPVHYPRLAPQTAWSADANRFRADGCLPDDAAWTRATVQPDGTVSLCCPGDRLDGVPSTPLGPGGFRAAWTSEPFQAVRRAGRAVPACGFCAHAEDPRHG
ncbi:MAG: radical SAM protein [Planctomycetes bacterium]|nr:radical SAM protein [Planctomycetota bacterium]